MMKLTKAQREVLTLLAAGNKCGQGIPYTPYTIELRDKMTGGLSFKTVRYATHQVLIEMGYITEKAGGRDWHRRLFITDAGKRALEAQS